MPSDDQPIRTLRYGSLPVQIFASAEALGRAAALGARTLLQDAVAARGEANIILATGNSQLPFLRALRTLPAVPWPRVRVFHMDEYVGLPPNHPASFPRFLRQHLLDHITPLAFYPIPGRPPDLARACAEYADLLRQYPADLVALGWGENGHLAFNDPPYADFDDPESVKVVTLAEASRRQQVGEGHFAALDEVPTQAITLTIPALLRARSVLCIVPEARKAPAVRCCLEGPVTENCPGSILRIVDHTRLYLDADSAAELGRQ